MKVAESVQKAIQPIFDNLDLRLVEVEYVKRHDGMHLVIYIDSDKGVTVEDCSLVAKLVDPIIEELNPTNDARYYLDISSYGLDKPLKFDWQFEKYLNKELDVKLYMAVDGLKKFVGTLISFNQEEFSFIVKDKNIKLNKKQIATMLPHIDF